MYRTVPLSIIRSFSLYTQQWYSWQFASRVRTEFLHDPARKLSAKPVWRIPLLCVQWKIPVDGQRNCPKHVEFYSINKFEKLVHLVGFIIRIYHDARSPERQIRIFICYSFSVLNSMLPACKPNFAEGSRTTWRRWSDLLYTFSHHQ